MRTDRLFQKLNAIHKMSESFIEALREELIWRELPRNFVLQNDMSVATHLYYLDTGFAVAYRYREGKRVAGEFWRDGQFVVTFESFISQTRGDVQIRLAQPSDVLALSYKSLQELLSEYADAQILYREIITAHHIRLLKKMSEAHRQTTQQRYLELKQLHPDIELIVSQAAVASHIGVTPQTLSRMKRLIRARDNL